MDQSKQNKVMKILLGVGVAIIIGLIAGLVVMIMQNQTIAKSKSGLETDMEALRVEHDSAMEKIKQNHKSAINSIRGDHAEDLVKRKKIHRAAVAMERAHAQLLQDTSDRSGECTERERILMENHTTAIQNKETMIAELNSEKTQIQTDCDRAQAEAAAAAETCAAQQVDAEASISELTALSENYKTQFDTLSKAHEEVVQNIEDKDARIKQLETELGDMDWLFILLCPPESS